MSYTALARKWRPKKFAELVGQEHVRRALVNALETGRVHHAFLFTGTRGVGKTTIARIFAKCLNCETGVTPEPCGVCGACKDIDSGRFVDLIEVDAASRTKVDDTRELLDNVPYAPTRGRYKVYLIDEVHMLSTHSFNALLKTLEEPPPHMKFLLATTDPQKLPATVLSRCLQFNLKRMPVGQIAEHMKALLEKEGVPFEPAGLRLVAQAADGSMRDGLSLLDQLIAFGGGKAGEEEARAMLGTISRDHVERLAELLGSMNVPELMQCSRSLEEFAPDYAQVLDELAGLLVRVAMKQTISDYEGDDLYAPELLERLAKALSPEDIQLFYQTAITGRRDLALAPDPRTGFEMTLLRMIAFRPANDAGAGQGPATGSGTAAGRGAAAAQVAAQVAAQGGGARGSSAAPSAAQPSGGSGGSYGAQGGGGGGAGSFGGQTGGVGGSPGAQAGSAAAAARAAAHGGAGGAAAARAAVQAAARGGAPSGGAPSSAGGSRGAAAGSANGGAGQGATPQSGSGGQVASLRGGGQGAASGDAGPPESMSQRPSAASGAAVGYTPGAGSPGGHREVVSSGGGARMSDADAEAEWLSGQHSEDTAATPTATMPGGAADSADGSWIAILNQLDLQGAARQLASHCVLVGRQPGLVRLALDPRVKFVRTSSQEEKLAQALSRHYGETVRLEFTTASGEAETPAQAEQRASQQELDVARQAFETDPGVKSLRERFGATLLPDTIRPVK
ncbi:MAG: polymerase subunit gamma/tau [Gammaproteobacteria bacterium]|nr:polymerase subunit gamma/tau [Gammaproteobacteria bacterium]